VTRITAWFESRASLLEAVHAARRRDLSVTTAILPAYDAEVIRTIGIRPGTGLIAAAAGAVGAVAAFWFMWWTVKEWPRLIVGGKPLVTWPTFLVVAFEMAILSAVLAAAGAFLVRAVRAHRAVRAYNLDAKATAFALLVACAPEHAEQARTILRQHGAVSCDVT
jgi:hypothetical protein